MAKTIWKDEYIIKGYELARAGLSERQIARAIPASLPTYHKWLHKRPVFQYAVKRGRRIFRGKGEVSFSFKDYVYTRLPLKLKETWDRLDALDKAGSGVEQIEALLADKGRTVRQHLFIHAWVTSNFSISEALRKVNLNRGTFDVWRKNDPNFTALVDEINWHKKNYFEDCLTRLVSSGDSPATIFVNKTLNADRGYQEKLKVDMNMNTTVNHVVSMKDLNLPLSIRKMILEAMRKKIPSTEIASMPLLNGKKEEVGEANNI